MDGLRIVGNSYHVAMLRSIIEDEPECGHLAREIQGIYHVGGWVNPRKARTWLDAAVAHMVVHWIGSDVLGLINVNGPLSRRGGLRNRVKYTVWRVLLRQLRHLAGAPWLAQELRAVGVPAEYAPLPVRLPNAYGGPLPQEPTFIVYLPEGRERFYGWEHVCAVAGKYPRTRWHVIAHSGGGLHAPANVRFHGWLPRDSVLELLSGSNALVRLVEHDGLSYGVLEALALGRYVIWTYDLPHCIRCNKSTADLECAIGEVLSHRRPNEAGSLYVRDAFDPKRVTLRLLNTLKGLAR